MHNKYTTLKRSLRADFPDLKFKTGTPFSWSPKERTVYCALRSSKESDCWSLLHEVSHAALGHKNYHTDFDLLLLEVQAWERAKEIAPAYGTKIDEGHVQDCLDSYRDWLHHRSTCPTCELQGIQINSNEYRCNNCYSKWRVSAARFCRPYRMKV